MFKIDAKTKEIHLTRGDKATLGVTATVEYEAEDGTIQLEPYIFQKGDVVSFAVHEKKGLNKPPLVVKSTTVEEETEEVNICLGCNDTALGERLNKEKELWYQIRLNEEQTLVGFDEEGEKILMLYPEGADE